jgi:hypothetical protein
MSWAASEFEHITTSRACSGAAPAIRRIWRIMLPRGQAA